jgi:hypothetical protein
VIHPPQTAFEVIVHAEVVVWKLAAQLVQGLHTVLDPKVVAVPALQLVTK